MNNIIIKRTALSILKETPYGHTQSPLRLLDYTMLLKTAVGKELSVEHEYENGDVLARHPFFDDMSFFVPKYLYESANDSMVVINTSFREFVDKYQFKIWNGDKLLCHIIEDDESKDYIIVRATEVGLDDIPVRSTNKIYRKDIKKILKDSEPEVIIIVLD